MKLLNKFFHKKADNIIKMRRYITILMFLLVFEIPLIYAEDINVTLINTESINSNKVLITWQDAGKNVTYNIYRSTEMLNSPEKIDSAVLLTNVAMGIEKVIDSKITNSGEYFYGVATVKNSIVNKNLIEDASYTTIPVSIKIEKKKIEPEPLAQVNTNTSLPPEKSETNIRPAPQVQVVKTNIKKYTPEKPKKITEKVKKKHRKKISYYKILQQAINYFYKANYKTAEKKLKFLIHSKVNKKLKNKAKLFLGKTYFYEKQYRKAIAYFVKIKPIYPDEAEFWINRSLNKIGE